MSSGLYRKCSDSTKEAFDIARVEQEMTENARQYTTLTNDDEILAEIQHFGGSTNLIDFTDDYLIALTILREPGERREGRPGGVALVGSGHRRKAKADHQQSRIPEKRIRSSSKGVHRAGPAG